MGKPAGAELAKVGFQYLGTPYSKMDCQAFIEKCLQDVGIKKDLAGSNAWYRYVKQNGWVGSPEECKAKYGCIPVGAFLFIHAFDGGEEKRGYHDGLGNASHIGIYTGTGEGAINSSYSRGCVCESKFSGKSIKGGWNMVGLWDAIDYGIDGGDEQMEAKVVLASGETGSTVNMRDSASKSGKLIMRVPVGNMVTVLNDLGAWCKIQYDGKVGYMMSNYLEYTGQDGESGSLPDDQVEKINQALRQIEEATEVIGSIVGRG